MDYPHKILGGDRFLDYWGPQSRKELSTVDGVLRIMRVSYELGIRGFDISLNAHVIEAFKLMKEKYPDIVGIGNPNWKCGIKLDDVMLDDLSDRVRCTLTNIYSSEVRAEINNYSEKRKKRWFLPSNDVRALDADEIEQICLDESLYRSKLEMLSDVVDYILIGTDYADWLVPLGREDILARMSIIVRKYELLPLSVSHHASITLPVLDTMDFEGHWIYLNQVEQLLSESSVRNTLKRIRHPVTAFRVLGGGQLANDLETSIEYIRSMGIQDIVVAAETAEQIKETMSVVNEIYKEEPWQKI